MTILQTWSQGTDALGRDGMRKVWSAVNVKVYGGGVTGAEYLGELTQLIGDHDDASGPVSRGRGGRSAISPPAANASSALPDPPPSPRPRHSIASGVGATKVTTTPG